MSEPDTRIPGWPQPGDPPSPQRGRQARAAIAILTVILVLWLCLGLGFAAMLTIANEEGFVQLFWIWAIGLVAWPVVLWWTYRRTRPG